MKSEKLFDSITDIRNDIIEEAENHKFSKPSRKVLRISAVAAVLVIAIISGVLLITPKSGNTNPVQPVDNGIRPMTNLHSEYAVTESVYPVLSDYPKEEDYLTDGECDYDRYYEAYEKWWNDYRAQTAKAQGYEHTLDSFLEKSMGEFLSGSDTENKIYSPVNVYMALSMLAEVTDGSSRAQILSLLGAEDMESLYENASAVWNGSYRNDSAAKSILASSLWLSDDFKYNMDTMKSISEKYYASAYSGTMGDPNYDLALQSWLNEQTGGLLKDQAANIEFDPETVLALASTVYFKAPWHERFNKGDTKAGTFYRSDGGEILCDFMNSTNYMEYYWGDNFGAVCLGLEKNSNMWLILPDEGYTPSDLLSDNVLTDFITADREERNSKHLTVNLSLPKFDVSSQIELSKGLKALGVTDIFDVELSDFSPMVTSDNDGYYVLGKAQHDARVMIDEEGCTAAAYTVLMVDGLGGYIEGDEIDFILDRPFIFAITSDARMPLFVGVVNDPV